MLNDHCDSITYSSYSSQKQTPVRHTNSRRPHPFSPIAAACNFHSQQHHFCTTAMVLLSAATRLAARNTLLTRNTASRMVHIEAKLEELNITLPPPPAPKANYNIVCRDGNTIYVSGHLPVTNDGTLLTGEMGIIVF